MEGMNSALKMTVRIRQSNTGTPPPPEKPALLVVASFVLAAAGVFLYTITK